jgi:hypothetical protein
VSRCEPLEEGWVFIAVRPERCKLVKRDSDGWPSLRFEDGEGRHVHWRLTTVRNGGRFVGVWEDLFGKQEWFLERLEK